MTTQLWYTKPSEYLHQTARQKYDYTVSKDKCGERTPANKSFTRRDTFVFITPFHMKIISFSWLFSLAGQAFFVVTSKLMTPKESDVRCIKMHCIGWVYCVFAKKSCGKLFFVVNYVCQAQIHFVRLLCSLFKRALCFIGYFFVDIFVHTLSMTCVVEVLNFCICLALVKIIILVRLIHISFCCASTVQLQHTP